ncbi:MAG: adenylate/guanylate cyclase domain-containing protein [Geminicoccaceae bacterium]
MKSSSDIETKLRLISGLVLMTFVVMHFINHALVLHSLDAVIVGQKIFKTIWRSPPGTLLLYGAFLVHIVLVILKIYRRRSLRMPIWEALQIILGLLIPFWLALHIIGTRGLHEVFGVDDSYHNQFAFVWAGDPWRHVQMLLLVWVHGCIGLHFWLRIRPWYTKVRLWLLIIAILLPGLALAGFHLGGREVQAIIANDPSWLERVAAEENWPDESGQAWVYQTEGFVETAFLLLIAAVFAARLIRRWRERSAGKVQIRYLDGTTVPIDPGMTVLDGSRLANIPHASVCGGRGRCSTCRVRLGDGAEHLPPAAEDEAKVLTRIGAGDGIRLACQLRPTQDLEVVPLLPATSGPSAAQTQLNPGAGIEREMAVLFADLRAFTRMAEGRLPFDVVFILNQYFKSMGAAIESAGGRVDKFIGDGIMALFGISAEPAQACQQALIAAKTMAEQLDHLHRQIKADLPEPLRIGIGLHAGPVILGEMGFKQATSLTAIGDAVNVASRLEALTKEFGAQLVVSSDLARRAKADLSAFETSDVDIRGRKRPLQVHVVKDAKSLPAFETVASQSKWPTFSITRLLGKGAISKSGA